MKYNYTSALTKNKFAFTSHIFTILIVGVLVTMWMINNEDKEMRQNLLFETDLLAQTIDSDIISHLKGDSTDLKNPFYYLLKEQLAAVKMSNDRYHFVYLLGRKPSGEVFFYVDNEPVGSENESVAGEVYNEASQDLINVFKSGIAGTEGPLTDQWGTFISSMVPIADKQTKKVEAVLGIDIDSEIRQEKLFWIAVPPMLLTFSLMGLLFVATGMLIQRERRGINAPIWMHYLESELVLVIGVMLTLFITRLSYDKEHQSNHTTFNRLASSRTEVVASKLNKIKNTELEGLSRYFSSNDFVRLDEFNHFTGFLTSNPNVQAWDWVPVVPANNLAEFRNNLMLAGIKNFNIWKIDRNNKKVPSTGKSVYYPVMMITPLKGNEVVLGFDLGSDSVRLHTIQDAIASPENIACSDPVTLVQDSSEHKGLIVARSVFKNIENEKLIGFAVAVIKMGMLLNNSVSDFTGTPVEIQLLYPDGRTEKIADNFKDSNKLNRDYTLKRYVFAYGKVFSIQAFAEDDALQFNLYKGVWLSLIAGLMLTLSLTIVLYFFVRNRLNLEKLIEERTQKLRESETLFRKVTEQLSDLIVIINRKGIIEYASPTSEALLGITAADLTGKYFSDFVEKSEIKKSLKAFVDLYSEEHVLMNEELRMKRADSSGFYGEVTGTPFYLTSGPAILLNIRDVTSRKKAAEEILRAKEKAEESDQLKTRFLINMSHEIRTPMNGILGFLELLKDMDLTQEERNMYISFVNKSGFRLMDTINNIIEMSKIETGQLNLDLEMVNLNEMMGYLTDTFKPQAAEKKLSFYYHPLHETLIIKTDKNKLKTVLVNMLKNAVKFTLQGGIEFGLKQEDNNIVFYVKDTGMGIPEDRLSAIFDRFVQADIALTRPYEGSGLGLSIAKAYVEKLGGTIRVESKVDKGSTFSVSLPVI